MNLGYLFTDTETTGVEASTDGLLQIGAIITDMGFNIKSYFCSYLKPPDGVRVTEEALKINKIRREDIDSAPPEENVMQAFNAFALSWGAPLIFAGYNCPFDLSFLDAQRSRYSGNIIAPYTVPWLDLLPIARRELKLKSHKLVAVAEHLGCLMPGAHDALADVYMTVRIARILCKQGAACDSS